MTPDAPPVPLRRYPIFQTSDSQEFRHAILTEFGGVRAEIENRPGFIARGNLVQLQEVTLIHGASNASVSISYPEVRFYRLLTAFTGHGEAVVGRNKTDIDGRQSCIISPGRETTVSGGGQHGWLSLRISAAALERKLISILGYRPKGDFEFETSVVNDRPEVRFLHELIKFFAHQLDSQAGGLPHLVLCELEQTITTALLSANRHSFSHLLARTPRDGTASEVRTVEDYIEANWHKPIRVEDLVALTNVSARTLFRTFSKTRGSSPMAFARLVRLKQAKQILSQPNPTTSVTGTALECGFSNLGHFAKYYADTFGERPSETLARSRLKSD
jgi:AraC-like DNA-binding protein